MAYHMKDRILLLLGGMLVAGSAWALWHFSGADGFSVVTLVALIVTLADNLRLRQRRHKRG